MTTLVAQIGHRAKLRDRDTQMLANGRVRVRGEFIVSFMRTNGRLSDARRLTAVGTGDEYADAINDMMRQALTALNAAPLRD